MKMTADGFVQRNDQTYSGGWDVCSVAESVHGQMTPGGYKSFAPLIAQAAAANKASHNTYLHAKPLIGWPADHSAEDTFCVPPMPPAPPHEDREYKAEFGTDGSARVYLVSKRRIGTFDTFADADLAAKALNERSGY